MPNFQTAFQISLLSFFQVSLWSILLILIVFIVRKFTIHKFHKRTFLILGSIVLVRLLVPISMPVGVNIDYWLDKFFPPPTHLTSNVMEINTLSSKSLETSLEYKDKELNPFIPPSPLMDFSLLENTIPPIPYEQGDLLYNTPRNVFDGGGTKVWSTASSPLPTPQNRSRSQNISQIIFYIWVVGALIIGLFFLYIYSHTVKYWRQTKRLRNHAWIDYWLAQQNLKRSVKIVVSANAKSPFTFGLIQPKIVLPANLDWTNHIYLKHILTHELIHIQRWDILRKILAVTALSLHWFNPFVWFWFIFYQKDIEMSCDAQVMDALGIKSRKKYATSLLALAEKNMKLIPFLPAFSRNQTKERIFAIMTYKQKTILSSLIATVLVLLTGFSAFALTNKNHQNNLAQIKQQVSEKNAFLPENESTLFTSPISPSYWEASPLTSHANQAAPDKNKNSPSFQPNPTEPSQDYNLSTYASEKVSEMNNKKDNTEYVKEMYQMPYSENNYPIEKDKEYTLNKVEIDKIYKEPYFYHIFLDFAQILDVPSSMLFHPFFYESFVDPTLNPQLITTVENLENLKNNLIHHQKLSIAQENSNPSDSSSQLILYYFIQDGATVLLLDEFFSPLAEFYAKEDNTPIKVVDPKNTWQSFIPYRSLENDGVLSFGHIIHSPSSLRILSGFSSLIGKVYHPLEIADNFIANNFSYLAESPLDKSNFLTTEDKEYFYAQHGLEFKDLGYDSYLSYLSSTEDYHAFLKRDFLLQLWQDPIAYNLFAIHTILQASSK